jgi:hypothetical protein
MNDSQTAATHCWMEMIRLRTDQSVHTGVEARVMAHLAQIKKTAGAPRVRVHHHLSVSNDLMIVLYWPAAPEAAGSSLAYSLCRELESYGLVDHTVWSADRFRGYPPSPKARPATQPIREEQLP